MSDAPRIIYQPRCDATPEGEINALSACYAFILQKHQEKKKGGAATALDARKESNGSGKAIIPKQP
jgi:hypothetical protein